MNLQVLPGSKYLKIILLNDQSRIDTLAIITNELLKLENVYNQLNKLEEIHGVLIMNQLSPALKGVINYATLKAVEPEKLYGVELQNIYIESIHLTKGKDVVYQRAIDEIQATVALIEQELELK